MRTDRVVFALMNISSFPLYFVDNFIDRCDD